MEPSDRGPGLVHLAQCKEEFSIRNIFKFLTQPSLKVPRLLRSFSIRPSTSPSPSPSASNSQLFSPSAVPSEALAGEDAVTADVATRDAVVATAKRAAAPRQGLNLLQRLRTPPVPHGQP